MAADWSGARTGESRGLRLATAADGQVATVRACTRVEVGDALMGAADRDPRLVVGLDFSFSLPMWWLDACGITEVGDLWGDTPRLESWLEGCQPPFWGRPGRRRPALAGDALRLTERCAPGTPGSVFQIGGAGAVGTASLRGMPTLARLRAAGFAVWPFDRWRPPVVAEVWPRLAIGGLRKSRAPERRAWAHRHRAALARGVADAVAESSDALDAVAASLWLAGWVTTAEPVDRAIVDGLSPADRRRVGREGWIAGVAPPSTAGRAGDLRAAAG